VDWINLAQNNSNLWALVKVVLNFLVQLKGRDFVIWMHNY
jgi:hypothetical protein